MTKQQAFEIIDNAGGPAAVAMKFHVSVYAVLGWIERGDIPRRWWVTLGVK